MSILTEQLIKHLLPYYLQPLNESNLSRFLTKYFDIGFIIITADRSCEAEKGSSCTEEEKDLQKQKNKDNEKSIRSDIKSAGYGYVPVFGGYREKVVDKKGEVSYVDNPDPEKSFLVPNQKIGSEKENKSITKLKQLGIELCKKYNQDSFLFKPSNKIDKNAYFIDKTGNATDTFSNVTYSDMEQIYFTRFRKRNPIKRISMVNECLYIPKPPNSVSEARKRYGEHFWRFL